MDRGMATYGSLEVGGVDVPPLASNPGEDWLRSRRGNWHGFWRLGCRTGLLQFAAIGAAVWSLLGISRFLSNPGAPTNTGGQSPTVLAIAATQAVRVGIPSVASNLDASRLSFFAGNKYTLELGQTPPGVQYNNALSNVEGREQPQVVEPYRATTFVVLGADLADAEKQNIRYEWMIGDVKYHGSTVSVTFTEVNKLTNIELLEVDASGLTSRTVRGSVVTKYVRREIRTLDEEDRTAFLDAMETLYRLPAEGVDGGRARFGEDYRDAFDFVAAHNELAGGRQCDHAHDGVGFLTIHTALSLQFERSLQAVNPSVSIPYWDYTIESARVEASGSIDEFYKSEVFAPDILGGFPHPMENSDGDGGVISGNMESKVSSMGDDHVITEGRWAYLPVTPKAWPGDAATVTNGYGLIRSPWNQNPVPYLTRCKTMFGADFDKVPTCEMHYDQMQLTDWENFGKQIQYKPHGSMHTLVAGGWGVDYYSLFLERGYYSRNMARALPLK
ncbi:unnamed protein product, partial [Choristocarpus tenellus]